MLYDAKLYLWFKNIDKYSSNKLLVSSEQENFITSVRKKQSIIDYFSSSPSLSRKNTLDGIIRLEYFPREAENIFSFLFDLFSLLDKNSFTVTLK